LPSTDPFPIDVKGTKKERPEVIHDIQTGDVAWIANLLEGQYKVKRHLVYFLPSCAPKCCVFSFFNDRRIKFFTLACSWGYNDSQDFIFEIRLLSSDL
jgi:hypothetical protein